MGPESRSSRRLVVAAERERQALDLRRGGLRYREIGEALGCSLSAAYGAVSRALSRIAAETDERAEELRALELVRLDALLRPMFEKAIAGDLQAVDRVLRIGERRARLLGLDAPARVHVDAAQLTPDEAEKWAAGEDLREILASRRPG
jgi:DNA-binding CsgD family transcriptional regulator